MKITEVKSFLLSKPRDLHIIKIETDAGIYGIGEAGCSTREYGQDGVLKHFREFLIGMDPMQIEHIWQVCYRGAYYEGGRIITGTMAAIDMALYDIVGKKLGVPVYQLLGGACRNYVECYATSYPRQGSLKETAQACIEAGFRAYRTVVSEVGRGGVFDARRMVRRTLEDCTAIREGVGNKGDWAIDYHTRLDFPDAVRLSTLLEPLEPLFCEDMVRSENPGVYRQLRPQVKVPIAVGEQFGYRWDANELIENRLIDYSRVTLPNCGGITEFRKLAALCETHYVGLIPHFTGPIAETALVHCCAAFPGPAVMELTGTGLKPVSYLPRYADFKNGKLYPNDRPGLGVEFDPKGLPVLLEVEKRNHPAPEFTRPDGSFTNW